jgi:hypothetical protein
VPASPFESPRSPFPGPHSQRNPRPALGLGSSLVTVDELLNGQIFASAERHRQLVESLTPTPRRMRQPDFGRSTDRRRRDRSLSPLITTL